MRAFSPSTHKRPAAAASVSCRSTRAREQFKDYHGLQGIPGRRDALLAISGAALTVLGSPALADVELTTFYGMDTPPASYGGYGGNSKESPRYKFHYPASWKPVSVNKVQKVRSRVSPQSCWHSPLPGR
jgi:hypothetical protein